MSSHARLSRRAPGWARGLLSTVRSTVLPFVACGALLLVACSDDAGGGGDDGAEVMGEACTQPGFTETGCSCDNGGMGSRTCTAEGVWTACACRPPRGEFECDEEGQEILCDPCPGEDEGRIVLCPASLMFDCSCQGQGRPGSMMDGGMTDGGTMDAGGGDATDAATDGGGSDDDGGADDDAG